MIRISLRMTAVAALVTGADVVADIGCDHAHVSIYLVQSGRAKRAIAMDLRRGPLEIAACNIRRYDLEGKIETRLSDGAAALIPGEADAAVIAGMGGMLMERIIKEGHSVFSGMRALILQPQSDVPRFRRFLCDSGYVTEAEDMVFEDGKYYPMMRVRYDGGRAVMDELSLRYGPLLIRDKNPVLISCLEGEMEKLLGARDELLLKGRGERAAERVRELERDMVLNREAYDAVR